jgi:hypothetical protein
MKKTKRKGGVDEAERKEKMEIRKRRRKHIGRYKRTEDCRKGKIINVHTT